MAWWTVLVLAFAACKFAPDRIGPAGDGNLPGEDSRIVADTPALDAPPGTIVRAIDIVDGKVAGGPHVNFPVLVALADNGLRGTAMGGDVENASGFDIRFFADSGLTTKLSHEVELYDSANGGLRAWVKIPSLTDTTRFFIHYGDPSITTSQEDRAGVWSTYAAVYHLSGVGDATGQNSGTNNGSTTATGQVLGARGFNGSSNSIAVASSASLDNVFANGGTVETWLFAEGPGEGNLGRVFEKGDVTRIGRCDGAVNASVFFAHGFTTNDGTWCTQANSAPLNTWIHFAATYTRTSSANNPTIYLGGVPVTITAVDPPQGTSRADTGTAMLIGDRPVGARAFDGLIDELRFSKTIRDAGWIATSFSNQNNPAAFVALQ